MTRILVVPERLHDLSRQMNQAAGELHNLEGHLGRALGGLDWQVRQQANAEGRVHAARSQARALAEQAETMARFLSERATAFQEADNQSYQCLVSLSGVLPQEASTSSLSTTSVNSWLNLGTLISTARDRARDSGQWLSYIPKVGRDIFHHVDWLTAIPVAALAALSRVDANGVFHVFGPHWLKDLAGVSTHLTWIRPENLGRHVFTQELRLSFSPLANLQTALGLMPVVVEDWRKYRGQGTATLVSALIIDSAISIATSKIFQIGGTVLGSALTPVLGPVVGYTVGGIVGSYVSDWIRQTPWHEKFVRSGADAMGWAGTGGQRAVSQAVSGLF